MAGKGYGKMSTTATRCQESTLTIVCDDRCPVVKQLAALVRWWDRGQRFCFVSRESAEPDHSGLIRQLDQSPWSLLLIDDVQEHWHGPEAIPIILKNLPFGKIAAVAYILPGTMWLTRQLYLLVSRNRRFFTSGRASLHNQSQA